MALLTAKAESTRPCPKILSSPASPKSTVEAYIIDSTSSGVKSGLTDKTSAATPAATGEELLRQCEIALTHAQERGETYVVFTPSIAGGSMMQTWFDVDEALQKSEFELHYQPKVELRSGRLVGGEALIRWQSPRAGLIAPGYFMPDIENTQGVRALFWFVLNTALKDAARWIQQVPDFSISVNMAPGNLRDPDLAEMVAGELETSGVRARHLVLEVNETPLMRDAGSSVIMLNKLRSMGVRISIDDFGSGFSSIAYLKNAPADELKIDQTLIAPICSNETDRRIVGSIIRLAQAVDLDLVAEGIEDARTMQALIAMGCKVGQGYHFAHPAPADEFETGWVSRQSRAVARPSWFNTPITVSRNRTESD